MVGGASPWMVRVEKASRRDWRVGGRLWREGCDGLGRADEVFGDLGFKVEVGAGGL